MARGSPRQKENRVSLALQGDFRSPWKSPGAPPAQKPYEVRSRRRSAEMDGLVIPGGEAPPCGSCWRKKPVGAVACVRFARPIFGNLRRCYFCGFRRVESASAFARVMDIEVERNAYGRQLERPYPTCTGGSQWTISKLFVSSRRHIHPRVGGEQKCATYHGTIQLLVDQAPFGSQFHPNSPAIPAFTLCFLV